MIERRQNEQVTYCLIPAPGPARFHVFRVLLKCCWLCAGTSSRPTGGRLTSRTSSARSRTQPTGTEWWLWAIRKDTRSLSNRPLFLYSTVNSTYFTLLWMFLVTHFLNNYHYLGGFMPQKLPYLLF